LDPTEQIEQDVARILGTVSKELLSRLLEKERKKGSVGG
jgi:hypothetical protein